MFHAEVVAMFVGQRAVGQAAAIGDLKRISGKTAAGMALYPADTTVRSG
jgi:hypothetical protein